MIPETSTMIFHCLLLSLRVKSFVQELQLNLNCALVLTFLLLVSLFHLIPRSRSEAPSH